MPPDEVAAQADLVLLAVPDDVLAGLVRGLAAPRSFRAGQIVVHTSGAHGVAVLAPAVEHGVLPLALHPVMTFTGRAEDVDRLPGASVGVTAGADEAGWPVGEALVVEMGADPVRVPEKVRPLYHAALTHGANHLVTLVPTASTLLGDAGVRPAERLVAPLLSAALDNALRHGDRALTGPVSRGDVGTVRTHLEVLTAADPDVGRRLPGVGRAHRAPGRRRGAAVRARGQGRADHLGGHHMTSPTNTTAPVPAAPRPRSTRHDLADQHHGPDPSRAPGRGALGMTSPTNITAPVPAAPPAEEHSS